MPKGQFIVMKTGAHPMKVKLKLFFQWGISFGAPHTVPDKGNRPVAYAVEGSPGAGHPGKVPAPGRTPAAKGEGAATPAGAGGQETPRQLTWQKTDKTGKGKEKMTDLKRIYQSDLPSRAIAVYLYLRGRANREGVCWPAIPTMARELKMSESTVRRGVRDLERAGFLAVEERVPVESR